jgi:hypothetical protein
MKKDGFGFGMCDLLPFRIVYCGSLGGDLTLLVTSVCFYIHQPYE